MEAVFNFLRLLFFTNLIGSINLYDILATIFKFVFVFIILYYISTIVKLIIIDIKSTTEKIKGKINYIIVRDDNNNEVNRVKLDKYHTIGRSINNNIVLNSKYVSKFHGYIQKEANSYYLVDNDSFNGIILNNLPVKDKIKLSNNDIIQIGNYNIEYKEEAIDGELDDIEEVRYEKS